MFLIVCNGRSGSTWLSTLLGQLPGVATDFEYRWSLPSNSPPDIVHRMIRDMPGTFGRDFASWAGGARDAGSKLVFSLEPNDVAAAIEGIWQRVDPDLKLIFLIRHYADVLLSFRFRGPAHRIDPADDRIERQGGVILKRMREVYTTTGEAHAIYPTVPLEELPGRPAPIGAKRRGRIRAVAAQQVIPGH